MSVAHSRLHHACGGCEGGCSTAASPGGKFNDKRTHHGSLAQQVVCVLCADRGGPRRELSSWIPHGGVACLLLPPPTPPGARQMETGCASPHLSTEGGRKKEGGGAPAAAAAGAAPPPPPPPPPEPAVEENGVMRCCQLHTTRRYDLQSVVRSTGRGAGGAPRRDGRGGLTGRGSLDHLLQVHGLERLLNHARVVPRGLHARRGKLHMCAPAFTPSAADRGRVCSADRGRMCGERLSRV